MFEEKICKHCTKLFVPTFKTNHCNSCRYLRRTNKLKDKCACGRLKLKKSPRCRLCTHSYVGNNQVGSSNPNWKQGRTTQQGYVQIRANGKYVMEHRKVMEDFLGRKLYKGENVHHKNGIRHDNRLENLELWVSSQPSGQRIADLLEWAHEIIKRYESKTV